MEVAENLIAEPTVPLLPAQPQDFLHLEIPEDELMNEQEMLELQDEEEDAQMEWQENDQVVVNNIQFGMVRVYSSFTRDSSQRTRQPATANSSSNQPTVSLRKGWAAFFKIMLDSPPHYEWAKKLLPSAHPDLLQHESDQGLPANPYSLPTKGPDNLWQAQLSCQ